MQVLQLCLGRRKGAAGLICQTLHQPGCPTAGCTLCLMHVCANRTLKLPLLLPCSPPCVCASLLLKRAAAGTADPSATHEPLTAGTETHSRCLVSTFWQMDMAMREDLPVPDCACAMTSLPCTMGSRARCWMAEGFSKP